MGMTGGMKAARPSASAPGSALRLLPSIALSSAQVIGHGSTHPVGGKAYGVVGVHWDGMAGPSASQPWVGIGGGVGGASAPGECRRMTAVDGHVRRDPHPFRFSTPAKNPLCPGEFESHSDGAWNAPSSRIAAPQRGRTVTEAARHGNHCCPGWCVCGTLAVVGQDGH